MTKDIIKLPDIDILTHISSLMKTNSSSTKPDNDAIWAAYREIWQKCSACPNIITDKKVFGVGNRNAKVMLVGEGPGANEEKERVPFVGEAGQLLNNGLAAFGIKRNDWYISNTVLCRCTSKTDINTISNRHPEENEMSSCHPRLEIEIGLVSPKVIVAMGTYAWTSLTGRTEPMESIIGNEYQIEYSSIDNTRQVAILIPTFHTAYVLHNEGRNPKVVKSSKIAIGKSLKRAEKLANQ